MSHINSENYFMKYGIPIVYYLCTFILYFNTETILTCYVEREGLEISLVLPLQFSTFLFFLVK